MAKRSAGRAQAKPKSSAPAPQAEQPRVWPECPGGLCADPPHSKFIRGDSAEVIYYGVVRKTIHGTDHLRVRTATAGITQSLTLLGLSAVCWSSLDSVSIESVNVPIDNFGAILLAAFSSYLAYVYLIYVGMFSSFLERGVGVAIAIEERLLCSNVRGRIEANRTKSCLLDVAKVDHPPDYLAIPECSECDRDLALTQNLQKAVPLAGARGAKKFVLGLKMMMWFSGLTAICYALEIFIKVERVSG